MTEKITSLTQEQEAKFPYYVNKWISIGKDCSEIDVELCKHYARIAYAKAGYTCPERFYVADGPSHALDILRSLGVELDPNNLFNGFIFGQHEASWMSFYDFMETELGIDCSDLEGLKGLTIHCGWWYPDSEFVIFTRKHTVCKFNERNLPHCEDGPAIAYQDGTKIWAINGTHVNEQIVLHPETLTIEDIQHESNTEVRAIMIERYGWLKFLENSGARLLDYRDNDVENTKEALYQTKDFGSRLVVTCPTGRVFAQGILQDVRTCEEAQMWLGSDENKEFNVIGRT